MRNLLLTISLAFSQGASETDIPSKTGGTCEKQ